jgi:Homeodomain
MLAKSPRALSRTSSKLSKAGEKKKRKKWDEDRKTFIRCRNRKTPEQLEELLKEFKRSNIWSEEDKERIGKKLGLDPVTVGKWNWDERKKRGLPTERKR